MFGKQVRIALLTGALAAAWVLPALGQDDKKEDKKEPEKIGSPKDGDKHPAPPMVKICVNEWVTESVPCTRTVYRTECRTEHYTAYRCETYTEPVVRNVCVSVPCVEQRTVMQAHWTCKPVTTVVRKCVDKGHYECREVPCEPSCMDRMRSWWKGKKGDCCEPCCPPPTKTVKVWVPCPVWEEHCVTKMVRTCEHRPAVVNVTVCKQVVKQETVNVCKTRHVPYQATRTVNVCVPHTEHYTATRLVCRSVEKLVPAAGDGCGYGAGFAGGCGHDCGGCASSCGDCCTTSCSSGKGGFFGRRCCR